MPFVIHLLSLTAIALSFYSFHKIFIEFRLLLTLIGPMLSIDQLLAIYGFLCDLHDVLIAIQGYRLWCNDHAIYSVNPVYN